MIQRISSLIVLILCWLCVRAYALEFALDMIEEML